MKLSRSAMFGTTLFAAVFSVAAPTALAKAPKLAGPDSAASVAIVPVQQCAPLESAPLFAPWGDLNSYSPFPGSTFEDGTLGWSWSGGANIVSGDDDQLLSAAGRHALQIPGGGTAKSPALCVDSTMPSMRLFIKRVSGAGNLTITGTLAGGKASDGAVLAVVSGSSTWAPTPPLVFPTYLADVVGEGSLSAQFLFTADKGTTFRIDDVAMDPYRRT